MSAPDDTEDLLLAYVRQALLARERGEPVDVHALCGAHPELVPAVLETLGLAPELGSLSQQAATADPDLHRVLGGRYRLEARLGRGAMGAVFAAQDLQLEREVAVKVFDTVGRSTRIDEERFAREATTLAALQHPHVVAIHDRGMDAGGARYLVMDRLHGASLATLLQAQVDTPSPDADFAHTLAGQLGVDSVARGESTWLRSAVRWCAQVADGLAAAHAAGIYHRDVKPSNVFVRSAGDAVLLDFGIAAREGDPALTTADSSLGTPWYMAPEQARRDRRDRPGAAVDVYGLSATLYHLVTGHAPYDGDAVQVIAALQFRDPRPPARARPGLARDLCAVIERGIERDPARRYPTVAALGADLRAFLDHRPVVARPIGVLGRALRAMRRQPARTSAASASLVALVSLAVVLPLWRAHRAQVRAATRNELLKAMPATIAVDGMPGAPLVRALGAGALSALDALLEIDPDDLPHRLWRAVLRLDRGEVAGAADDVRELRQRSGNSAFTVALTERYLQRATATAADALDVLPAPGTDFDSFLAGFDELRNRQRDGFARRADDHLARVAERYLPARDLRLLALVERGDAEQDRTLYQLAADEALWLEGHYGYATARTLAMRGAALLGLRRVDEAAALLEASDRLRPDRHGTLHNLGVARRRQGRLDDAIALLTRAYELRPDAWNTPYMLALVHKDRRDFTRALALCDAFDLLEVTRDRAWRKPELRGTILLRRAIELRGEDGSGAPADAQTAAQLFEQAAQLASGAAANDLRVRAKVAAAVTRGHTQSALTDFLALLRRTPEDPYQISNLASLLPEAGLEPAALPALRRFLRALAIALADGDPAFQEVERTRQRREGGQ